MAIVTLDEFTEYLKNETGATDSAQISAAKAAAEDWVRQHCGRTFEVATGTATARTYGSSSIIGCSLYVDDIADDTGLEIVNYDTTLTTDYFQLLPLNGLTAGRYTPYDSIETVDTYWYESGTKAWITVTANWGWLTVPDAVKEAVKIIGKDFVTARTSRFGYIETGVGPAQGGRNWLALNLLHPYRRPEMFCVAV